ncbi:MAG TPA: hypothetical protein VHG89_07715 [Verrucomicrobiae bacterium]|nr:hypothetical protein [Verrucomicrobiae bacterium]
MKFFAVIMISALVVTGCVSKSTANARAHKAYLAGQAAALNSMNTRTNIVILGDVQNHELPWTDDLTLARAIVAAGYDGLHDPKRIILQRQGEQADIDPKDLLRGGDVPLEPGDIITVNER